MFKFAIILLALIGNQAIAAEKHNSVPANFQGDWSASLKKCGTEDEMNLTILSNTLQYWESGGSLISIVTNGEYELALISEMNGEGEAWLGFSYFRLSANKNELTDISDSLSETPALRYRCPSK